MFLGFFLLVTALSISAASAFFSITGLAAVFAGSVNAVIVMGIILELGKLASVAFLHTLWRPAQRAMRYYLVAAVITLMFVNSIGIFGFLSKAHIEQEVLNAGKASGIEIVVMQLENEKSRIADDDTQIGQIDAAIKTLTNQGRAQTSLQQRQIQAKQRDKLVADKLARQAELSKLQTQKVAIDNENRKLDAEFGPLKYIADLISAPRESVVRWLMTIIVFVFDPLALVLLNASLFTLTYYRDRRKNTNPSTKDMMIVDLK